MKTTLLAAAIFLLTLAAYSNSFHNSFHFDDAHTIANNLFIRNIANIPLFFKDSTTFSSLPTNQSYRPVVSATLAIDYWLGNGLDDTFYFHLSMFIVFIIQGILMVFLYRRVFDCAARRQANIFMALLAVGWYLVHPANAETINYIISRSDSFSAMFIVLCFVMYGTSRICRTWHLYLLPLGLGMLTKPIACIFPVLLLFYIFLLEQQTSLPKLFSRNGLRRLGEALKKTLPACVFTLGMLLLIKFMEPPTWTPGGASLFRYVITQPWVMLHYFLSFFLPVSLSADTDLSPFQSTADVRFFAGLLFLAVMLAAAVLTSTKRKLRPVCFGILWFFLTLLPTSLIPLAEVMNDHRVFLPYIGLMLSVSWSAFLLFDYCRRRMPQRACNAAAAVLAALLLTAGAYGTHQRNEVWKTEETLWKDVTEKSPKNGRGLMNYGLSLMAKGDYAGAEHYFLKALALTPRYATLHINLGVLNGATGKLEEAERFFKKAMDLQPRYPEGYYHYALFLNKQKRHAEAAAHLKKTLDLAPAHMEARHQLMALYRSQGDRQNAAALARQTLAIAPADPQALKLLQEAGSGREPGIPGTATPQYWLNESLARYRAGEFFRSIEAAQKALQLRPDYDLAYNNICAAYNELGQWDKAIEAGERAVRLNPGNQLARNNLAWARSGKAEAAAKGATR